MGDRFSAFYSGVPEQLRLAVHYGRWLLLGCIVCSGEFTEQETAHMESRLLRDGHRACCCYPWARSCLCCLVNP